MDLGRRGFLSVLMAAAVAPDPERLLWTPGKKLISIPLISIPSAGYSIAFHKPYRYRGGSDLPLLYFPSVERLTAQDFDGELRR